MPSSYPTALDSHSTSHVDNVSEPVRAATINDMADAVNKIESNVGLNPTSKATPTYSASITPVATDGPWQTITVTNATAFTINAPTSPPDSSHTRELTIEILNSSGGAMGAITWNAAFKLVGGAFTNPANANKRYIRFEWNGANWVETSRATADYT